MNGKSGFWLIAGPNGVGKTTYAFRSIAAVSGSMNFINLDEIARGLSPLDPRLAEREAARIAMQRAHSFIARHETFSMETTMAGNVQLALMQAAREMELPVSLLYFSVRSPDICLERIARRVAEGGHDVDAGVVRRRFTRSHANLARYCEAADLWRIYEASRARPCLAAEGRRSMLVHSDSECASGANGEIQAFIASLK